MNRICDIIAIIIIKNVVARNPILVVFIEMYVVTEDDDNLTVMLSWQFIPTRYGPV